MSDLDDVYMFRENLQEKGWGREAGQGREGA